MEKHWTGFLNAVSSKQIPQTSEPYPNTDGSTGSTGFLDVMSRKLQSKYDPMTTNWVGPDASNKALNNGSFKSEAAPVSK